MTNEELVVSYQKGNKQALEQLIENNQKFIYKVANKFYTDGISAIDKDDLIQEGNIGFIKACDKYDVNNEQKASFTTYAFHWIYSKIHRFITTKDTNNEISLNIPVGEEQGSEKIDLIESDKNYIEDIEEKIYLQELREELEMVMNNNNTLHEREVLKLYYGWDIEPIATGEIADLFDTSSDKIRQIKSKAIRKIRSSTWGRIQIRERFRNDISLNAILKKVDFEREYLNI